MADSIVIIPTYNERENIVKIIHAVQALPQSFDILIVDDNSPDGTAALVRQLIADAATQGLYLIERSGKLGLGTAYIEGFRWSLLHAYDYIFEMDADFSHNPNDLLRLYAACANEGYDMAIGSRYITGANVVNWPLSRIMISYGASLYVRMVTGIPVHDTTAGFVCYRRRVLAAMELARIRCKGYAFQIEMKYTAYKMGARIKEVSVVFVNRREGTSKMSGGIFSEGLRGVLRMRLDSLHRRYPTL